MPAVTAGVLPGGPVFVSYRHSDGISTAVALAWLLRASGVPVWQDQTDLPPGDTEQRLDEALASGLSGGVLVVTPEIAKSGVIRHQELPRLLDLAQDRDFVMAVASTIVRANGHLDYGAPDRLLDQPGAFGSLKQYQLSDRDGLAVLVRDIAAFRAGRIAASRDAGTPLHLSLQTRGRPRPPDGRGAELPIALRQPTDGRLPSRDGALDLQTALPFLPDTVARTGATSVRITGGAHLSLAFAVGASLPSTLIGSVVVEDRDGEPWSCASVSGKASETAVRRVSHGMAPLGVVGAARAVVAFVELTEDAGEPAYTRLLAEHAGFAAWEHLRPAAAGRVDPATAGPLVEEIASRLRTLSQQHGNATLHLLLRCPFPVAVLLGRLCNTLRCVLYEWDDTEVPGDPDHRARYVPSVAVAAGRADGPITEVLLPSAADAAGSAA